MEIIRGGAGERQVGAPSQFVGEVHILQLFRAQEGRPLQGAYVTFEPGARSNWHTHPMGQLLVVTLGRGRVGNADGTVQPIRRGDVIWTPPNERHWHGADPKLRLTHLSIAAGAEWFGAVSDQEYRGSA